MKLVLDTHTHTIASGHAYNTLNEMVRAAAEKGLQLLAVTEHGPAMPGSCQEIYFHNLRAISRVKYGVKLLLGCEMNIMDLEGRVDLALPALEEIDIGIASMHIPCVASGSVKENTRAYQRVMENPYVNIIGHPDDSRYPVDYRQLVQEAKKQGVLLELNNSSLKPNGFRQDTRKNDMEMLRYCMEYQVPVVVGSDAHVEEDVGNFTLAQEVLEAVGFPEELVANTSVDKLMGYLR